VPAKAGIFLASAGIQLNSLALSAWHTEQLQLVRTLQARNTPSKNRAKVFLLKAKKTLKIDSNLTIV